MTPAARWAAGAIAVTAWIGLFVQLRASVGLTGSVPAALWTMALYFTVLTNLMVAALFTGIALGRRGFSAPRLVAGVTLAIILVGIVYALLLRGLLSLSGGAWLADLLFHTATPILVPLYWLAFQPKRGLTDTDPLRWLTWPLLYFAYAIARGVAAGRYAYPFLDVEQNGWPQVLAIAGVMAAGFLAGGYALLGLDRILPPGPVATGPGYRPDPAPARKN